MCSSRSCFSSTGDGAWVSRSWARWVLGKAITSRIDSEPGAIAADGVFRYTPRVFDADGDRLFRYALLESPRGMRIDLVDGRIEWRPSEAQAGSHRVVVRVDDRNGDAVTQSFRIEVSFREFPVGRRSGEARFGHGASLHGAPRG